MPNREQTYEKDKTIGERADIFCSECNRATKHDVVTSYDLSGAEWDTREGWSVDWNGHYQVIQCRGCETLSFRHRSWFSEDFNPEFGEDGYTEALYPKRGGGIRPTKSYMNVPFGLRRIYREVIDTFNNDSATLCAAGLRAIVEGICADQEIIDGPVKKPKKGGGTQIVRATDLAGKISGLNEKGLLTTASAQNLHEHRYMGNDAIHQLDRPSVEELRLAIEIVEHIFEQLYEIPEKALELKAKMARRKKKL